MSTNIAHGVQVNSLKQITFKEIIQHYKKQPQAKTEIFRTVVITQSDPDLMVSQTGDIIEFYNAVFIPTVKSFVLKLGSRKAPLIRSATLQNPQSRKFICRLIAGCFNLECLDKCVQAVGSTSKPTAHQLQDNFEAFSTDRQNLF